jgi:predicted ATP-grasp superfamily ATP-dependent carboligase
VEIVLICHWSISGHHVLRALRAAGARVHLIHDDHAVSLRYSSTCSVLHRVASLAEADADEIAGIVNELHRRRPVDYVTAGDLEGLLLVARMRPALAPAVFPMSPQATLLRLHDKWEFFRTCQDLGIDVPRSICVQPGVADAGAIISEIGFPLVIKPTALYGQRDILFIANRQQLVEEFLRAGYAHPAAIVQEYVPGLDWGASVFARDGRIVNWTTFVCPDFVSAEFAENRELLGMATKIVAETGFTGVANFDARLDDRTGRMKLFECNPRFFLRMSATRLCGLDFVKAATHPQETPASLTAGRYYHWRELRSVNGIRALLNGTWETRLLMRDLSEMLRDPLPIVARRIWGEDGRRDIGTHPGGARSGRGKVPAAVTPAGPQVAVPYE